jgi:hypothetical protein
MTLNAKLSVVLLEGEFLDGVHHVNHHNTYRGGGRSDDVDYKWERQNLSRS